MIMKYFNFIIVCLIGQFSMTACSNEEEIPVNIKSNKYITVNMSILPMDYSRK